VSLQSEVVRFSDFFRDFCVWSRGIDWFLSTTHKRMRIEAMRCYHWTGEQLEDGIPLIQDKKLGELVFLGEEGPKGRFVKLTIHREHKPWINRGRLMGALPEKITQRRGNGRSFWVMRRQYNPSNNTKSLVRVYSKAFGSSSNDAHWQRLAGEPRLEVDGRGRYPQASSSDSFWCDALISMSKGDIIAMTRDGEICPDSPTLVYGERGFKTMTFSEFTSTAQS